MPLSIAQEIGDLHGYSNARIAGAHVTLSQGNFKRAIEALLWASHPPPTIGANQPSPRFIAGEPARAWAILEWKYQLQVVPLTTKTDRLYASEALVILNGKESRAMADQIATISKLRLFKRAGVLPEEDMLRIGEAIKIQLDIY